MGAAFLLVLLTTTPLWAGGAQVYAKLCPNVGVPCTILHIAKPDAASCLEAIDRIEASASLPRLVVDIGGFEGGWAELSCVDETRRRWDIPAAGAPLGPSYDPDAGP